MSDLDLLLVSKPTENTLQQIPSMKGEMILLRKWAWSLREVISGVQRSESSVIRESTEVYLRNVYNHTIQIIDTIELLGHGFRHARYLFVEHK